MSGAATRPNILLLLPDQHRGDTVGYAGNRVVQTPNIDRLAAEGVAFERAYSQSPLCQPARASLLTGLYPRQHGVFRNERSFPGPEAPNFLHQLKAAGYHTAQVGKVHIGVVPRGTARVPYLRAYGFDEMEEVYGKMAYLRAGGPYIERLADAGVLDDFRHDLLRRLAKTEVGTGLTAGMSQLVEPFEPWYAGPAPVPEELYIDNYVGDLAVDWLQRYEGDEPFFLWVGFCGPHDPHDAPQSYADRYLERLDEIPVGSLRPPDPTPSELYNGLLDWMRDYAGTGEMTADDVRRLRAYYYANVSLIDERIGDILGVLDERGWLDNTWIVYSSDHGDLLGDHQTLAKVLFYDGAVRVPLVVRPPGGTAGRQSHDIVELNDVGATVLDAAGAEQPRGSSARSLLGYLDGTESPRERTYSEVLQFSTVITDRYTYTVERESGAPCLLFDHESDPDEDHNLAGDAEYEGVRADLGRQLPVG